MVGQPLGAADLDDATVYDLLCRAHEAGLNLEIGETGFSWEAAPGQRHQEIVLAVTLSVSRPIPELAPCGCHRVIDLAIRFPDGLVKRPDVAIFCKRPTEDEGLVHEVPEAVIEVTSPGYEDKDLTIGPPIYLRNGVKDVLVLDRRTSEVHHWSTFGRSLLPSPHDFTLACGCTVTV